VQTSLPALIYNNDFFPKSSNEMVFTEPRLRTPAVSGSPAAGGAALPGRQPRCAEECSQLQAPSGQRDFLQATSVNDSLNLYLNPLSGNPVIL